MAIDLPSDGEVSAFRRLSSADALAEFFGTSTSQMSFDLYSKGRPSYRQFRIRKAGGGFRDIASPPPLIALYQRKLLSFITAIFQPKSSCHGFTPKRSVVTNARSHVGRRLILNLDLLDFFPSLHFGRVFGVFRKRPFNFPDPVAALLAQICCNNGIVPQGGPTSPMVANLICRGLDRDLERFSRRNSCRYTRYADDLTFSTQLSTFSPNLVEAVSENPFDPPVLGQALQALIAKHDFKVNGSKTRLRRPTQCQEVTGLVVNAKVNTPRRFVRNIRGIIHYCETRGIDAADQRFKEIDKKHRGGPTPHLVKHLHGKLNYLQMVRGQDDPLYFRYAVRMQALFPLYKHGVPLWGRALNNDSLTLAVWVLVGKDKNGFEVKHGTAFTLLGEGIVSALHTFENPEPPNSEVVSWEIFNPSQPAKRYKISQILEFSGLDITIINVPTVQYLTALRPSNVKGNTGQSIKVAGYPDWHSLGDKLFVSNSTIVQWRVVSCREFILTNTNVRSGMSGGPILAENGEVIGVTVYDGSNPIAPNGGISIRHLEDLKKGSFRKV